MRVRRPGEWVESSANIRTFEAVIVLPFKSREIVVSRTVKADSIMEAFDMVIDKSTQNFTKLPSAVILTEGKGGGIYGLVD